MLRSSGGQGAFKARLDVTVAPVIDGFQMSIERPTSGGQTCDEEAAVQRTFHLERSSFFYLSVLMVRTQCSTYYPVFCT